MRILLTGHKGYIGAVAGPMLRAAGHEVVGLDADLFAGCDFGEEALEVPEIRKDIRDVTKADLDGFDAVVHLAALSNDPLGNLDATLTYDINHLASVRLAELAKAAGVKRFVFLLVLQHIRRSGGCVPRRNSPAQSGDTVWRVQGFGRARHRAASRRAFQPNLFAECDRVWRISSVAARHSPK